MINLFFSHCFLSYGQKVDQLPVWKEQNDFKNYLSTEISSDYTISNRLCEKTIISIMFTINKEGIVSKVKTSVSASDYLKYELEEIVLKTNGKWEPALFNGKPIESPPMIMIIELNANAGCPDLNKDSAEDKTSQSLHLLFQFDEGKHALIEGAHLLGYLEFVFDEGFRSLETIRKN